MPPILFEDTDVLVINKPAGISVHSDGKTPEKTIADIVLEKYPELAGVGETMMIEGKAIPRPGIVHRLDKETSGALIIAKTQAAYEFLKKQFQNHEVKKVYHAFVYGWPKDDEGTVSESIGRSSSDVRKWTSGRGKRGTMRDALTNYRVLSRFGDRVYEGKGSTEDGTYTYLEALPQTGRTHQIRVHLKYLNHPIIADSLYAPERPPALGFKRLALHAYRVTFTLPSGEPHAVEAPFPADFQSAILLAEKGTAC